MSRSKPARPAAPAAASAAPALAWLDVRGPFLVPALLLLVTRLWFASQIPFAAEDAYITFRYARNFAHGLGPVFNPGEHVFGFTSAPWMAWNALGVLLGQDPMRWSRVTLLAADLVTLLAMGSLLRRHASLAAAWCFALFFAGWPYFAALAATGLEPGAMLALIALTAWWVDRRHPLAGATLGLLAVFRPEGLVAALALGLWASNRDRLVAAGVLAAVFGALALYFGSPLPQSMLAKAAVYGTPGPLGSKHWWDWALPFPVGNGLANTSEGKNFFLVTVLVAPAAVAGIAALWRGRTTALAAAAAAAAAVWLGYIGSGAVYFYWYFATPLFAWIVLAAAGLPTMVRGWYAYAAAALAIAGHWTFEPTLYIGRAYSEGQAFGTLGEYIARRATKGEAVCLEPIGTVGWRAPDVRVLDEVGLVTAEVATRRRQGPGWYADLLVKRRPEWLVVRAGLLRRGEAFTGAGAPFRSLEERLQVLAAYDTAAVGDTTAGDDNFVVLVRRDRPAN